MAIPTFVGIGAQAASGGAVTPAMPTEGVLAGDILLLVAESHFGEAVTVSGGTETWALVPDAPVQVDATTATQDSRLTVFWARASQDSPTSPTTNDPGDHICAGIAAYRGAIATGNPFDVSAADTFGPGGSSTVTIPGDTTTVDDCLIIFLAGQGADTAVDRYNNDFANASLSSPTKRAGYNTQAGGGGGFLLGDGGKATAGAYSATTGTMVVAVAQTRLSLALLPAVSAGAFELDAQPGSYALTGTLASPVAGRIVTASPATYTLTGTAATVPAGRALNAATGTYTLTGTAAGLLSTRLVNAGSGTYTLTGSAAGLPAGRSINADLGAYVVTGSDADLVLTGAAAAFSLNAEPGGYALTGADAGLIVTYLFHAESGSYTVSGVEAALVLPGAFVLDAEAGSYAITGANAQLAAALLFNAEPGSYTATGLATGLALERSINAAPGTYAIVGTDTGHVVVRALLAAPGVYLIAGADANLFSAAVTVAADVTIVTVTPPPAVAIIIADASLASIANAATEDVTITG